MAVAWSEYSVGIFIIACGMVDLMTTAVPPFIGLGPNLLYILSPIETTVELFSLTNECHIELKAVQ